MSYSKKIDIIVFAFSHFRIGFWNRLTVPKVRTAPEPSRTTAPKRILPAPSPVPSTGGENREKQCAVMNAVNSGPLQ